jgi:hypothetical protein
MRRLQHKAHDAAHGLYEHNPQDQRELDRLNGQTQLLLHDGATLMGASFAPPFSPSIFAPTTSSASAIPNHNPAKTVTAWDLQENPSTTPLPTGDSGHTAMANLLHPTVASDLRVFDIDLLASSATEVVDAGPWNRVDPHYVHNENATNDQLWDDVVTSAADITAHLGQPQGVLNFNSARETYPNNHDTLASISGDASGTLLGFDIGTGIADFGQQQINGQSADMRHQMDTSLHNISFGVLGQQQHASIQLGGESLQRVEFERAWHGFMEQLGVINTSV